MSTKEDCIARALNQLSLANLRGASSAAGWDSVISDYFLDDDNVINNANGNGETLSDDSDSCSDDDEVISELGAEVNDGLDDSDLESDAVHLNGTACASDDDFDIADSPELSVGVENVMQTVDCVEESKDEELQKISDFVCDCSIRRKGQPGTSCSKKLLPEFIYKTRLEMSELSSDEKDLILLGKISCMTNLSPETQRSKKVLQKQRQHQKTSYLIEGQQVCRHTFRFVHGIGQHTLNQLFSWYKEQGLMPREKKRGGRRNHKLLLKHDDIVRVVSFITNYAEDHAVVLPGRHPGQRRYGDAKLLPSNVTKASVWRLYQDVMNDQGQRAVQKSTFRKLWKTLLPHIVRTKPMSDLCWECQRNNYAVYRSANLPDCVKSAKLRKQEKHLLTVKKERSYYQLMVKNCKETCHNHGITKLQATEPASHDICVHYSFDYAQQVHFPSDPLQPGPIYFLTPRKCALFGINCEGIPQQVNYLVDEGMASSKGSNSVISYLHHFFSNYGLGEKHVDLHCDNCSGQNKNRYVLWYLAWRTIHGLHCSVSLNFLVVGHTKFAPDWCFGLLKQMYRRTKVSCLDDIANVVKNSTVSNVNLPQLVGREDGTVFVPTFDWQTFLSPYFRPLAQIKSFHHFNFDSSSPGKIVAKMYSDSEEVTSFQLLKNPAKLPPVQLPDAVPPPGLDAKRQKYLFEHIRDFCDEDSKDITCPKPRKK